MRKFPVGLLALTASFALGVTTLAAKDYGDGGGGGGNSHQSGGGSAASRQGGGGEKMRGDGDRRGGGGGGGEKIRQNEAGGGAGERMRHRDDGGRDHHRGRGHWRGGVWIYDYDGGYDGGSCYRWRRICADRWGWGGPGFRRCLWRHGC